MTDALQVVVVADGLTGRSHTCSPVTWANMRQVTVRVGRYVLNDVTSSAAVPPLCPFPCVSLGHEQTIVTNPVVLAPNPVAASCGGCHEVASGIHCHPLVGCIRASSPQRSWGERVGATLQDGGVWWSLSSGARFPIVHTIRCSSRSSCAEPSAQPCN